MRPKSPSPVSTPHTRAWLAFEQNADSILHMVHLAGREIRLLNAELVRLTNSLGKPVDLTTKANVAKLQRFSKSHTSRISRYMTVTHWQVAMLVTCIEAHLQDLLSAAARVGPELMSESQQLAPYADVIAASSLDELASELRVRWARAWLSDGGPTRWISRLVKMGVRGYPTDLAPRLELIWGVRHAVVHAAGIATADFVKRHPDVNTKVGDRLRVNSRSLKEFLDATRGFMEPTEQFFLARYPSLLAPPSKGPAN